MRRVIVAALALGFATFVGAAESSACAPAPREGEVVRIADEEALIVWDAQKRVEHFIRRASFRSSSADFGFLVPTPSKPALDQIDGAVFQELATKLTPRVIEQPGGTEIAFGCTLWGAAKSVSVAAPEAQAVRVLGEQRVAGYDAVILAADDAEALATWLESHGYAKGTALTEWLAPYVASHWVLTAFKIADPNGESGKSDAHAVGTPAVHMTFAAERAFYPYREPKDQRETVGAGFEAVAVP
ncbi:MAG TPA: DUF2330 domain-containing protein, partial [Polyangiaceae bacterium]|nr:DUF2330 domain-containing protein [Polyangiaceae bacterium]